MDNEVSCSSAAENEDKTKIRFSINLTKELIKELMIFFLSQKTKYLMPLFQRVFIFIFIFLSICALIIVSIFNVAGY